LPLQSDILPGNLISSGDPHDTCFTITISPHCGRSRAALESGTVPCDCGVGEIEIAFVDGSSVQLNTFVSGNWLSKRAILTLAPSLQNTLIIITHSEDLRVLPERTSITQLRCLVSGIVTRM
jgi:hypothetical protein